MPLTCPLLVAERPAPPRELLVPQAAVAARSLWLQWVPGSDGAAPTRYFTVQLRELPRGQWQTYSSSVSHEATACAVDRYPERGFPGGAVVESLPANNAGDTGSSPGLGGSHMPRSNWAREPQLLSMRVWSLCSATREAAIVRGPRTAMKGGPRLPRLEKALAQKRRPNTAINK